MTRPSVALAILLAIAGCSKTPAATNSTASATRDRLLQADMPAQALGYKVGVMEFWRLRRKAERELGSKFDASAFHALILDAGGLPMTAVDKMSERWIARTKSANSRWQVSHRTFAA